jgi:enoyl-CoA hydratase
MSQRLPRAIGNQRARLLSYTSRAFTGVEAAQWGLAAEAVPDDRFDDALAQLTTALAANSREALIAHKRLNAAATQLPLDEGLRFEAESRFDIADTEERIASFR